MKRRDFSKILAAAGVGAMVPWRKALAVAQAAGQGKTLSDPALQPMFVNLVPNAMDPGFMFSAKNPNKQKIKISVGPSTQMTGLVGPAGPVSTPIFGYGLPNLGYTWPGRTIEAQSGVPVEVTWENKLIDPVTGLPLLHLLPVDTSLHWAYSLMGYQANSIAADGVPIVAHLHGGHTDFQFDGNPEFFFSPGYLVRGPQWVEKKYVYDNSQPAGTLWYHDHALGITRLNVYAGMAGFYILRDAFDTGMVGNAYDLPVFPYEAAFAIQDRMFEATGQLFYPAYPGDPFYDDFITGEGAALPAAQFPGGGPTGLAEFFGDHMVVNGVIWPKMDVEPRNYRLRLLNGCDSRFLAVQFYEAAPGATQAPAGATPIPFTVIGSDQGLASSPTTLYTLLMETGSRYDIIVDFKNVTAGNRVIMKNIGGDEPFGGDIPGPVGFNETDRIMAFDVVLPLDTTVVPDATPAGFPVIPALPTPTRTRKVALFEGKDEFGRLQPLLGTAEPATNYLGNPVNWPATPQYSQAMLPTMPPDGTGTLTPLVGQMEGGIAWHSPTTENPALGATEEWEVWNMTGDAHPVHLHLVHFEVVGRQEIVYDSAADADGFIPAGSTPAGDGVYLVPQPTVQHNSIGGDPTTYGMGFKIVGTGLAGAYGAPVPQPAGYVENAPKDMVTALPGQITRIKATFDKPGRYVWHCHILSHEDHEMMRVLHVGPGAVV